MDELKKAVAIAAAKQVQSGSIVGLGSGTTVAYFLEELGRRIRDEQMDIAGVPTSFQTRFMARQHGIRPLDPVDVDSIDIAVDGADEVDPKGNLIKGGGGAQVQEKLVAAMSRRFIIVVDESKLVQTLGEGFSVPVEVISPALSFALKALRELGGVPVVREAAGKLGPVISDLGNPIIDVDFGAIQDAPRLNKQLNGLPGVVGHGIFVGAQDQVMIARPPLENPKIDTLNFDRTASG